MFYTFFLLMIVAFYQQKLPQFFRLPVLYLPSLHKPIQGHRK
ncbi:hypothetical protein [Alysiella crassa]|nr:hypothetical protein [Alysiella crassa]